MTKLQPDFMFYGRVSDREPVGHDRSDEPSPTADDIGAAMGVLLVLWRWPSFGAASGPWVYSIWGSVAVGP